MHQLSNRRLIRSLAVASTAALLTLTAACGGSGDDEGASSSSGSSSKSSDSSSSSESSKALTTSDIGQRLSSAQKDEGTFSFEITTSTGGQKVAGSGEADISGAEPASDVTIDVAGQKVQAISVDGQYYLKGSIFQSDKPYVKIDPNASSGLGAVFGQLGVNADPSKALGVLTKSSKVTKTGEKKVGDTDTTVYKVEVPTTALGQTLNYPETLLKELPDTLTYTLYVDDDDLVRRQDSSLSVRGTSVDSSVTFDDYGEDVSISAPPAGQVTTKQPALPGLSS